MSSPLDGIRIIEIAAIGPAPYGLMLLGDLGAEAGTGLVSALAPTHTHPAIAVACAPLACAPTPAPGTCARIHFTCLSRLASTLGRMRLEAAVCERGAVRHADHVQR